MQAIEDLKKSVEQLEAVAEMIETTAYAGFGDDRVGSVVVPPSTKRDQVTGGIKVRDQRFHQELEKIAEEAGRKAREISAIAGKFHRKVWDMSPGEKVDEKFLEESLKRWERRRKGLTRGRDLT